MNPTADYSACQKQDTLQMNDFEQFTGKAAAWRPKLTVTMAKTKPEELCSE
jgi:hypothetical protein